MSFKPMLATAPKMKDGKPLLNFPLHVQPKLDGIRASVVDTSGEGPKVRASLLTRTLKEVPNREVFNALSHPDLIGLDGELIVGDPTADDCYRRTTSFCMSQSKTGEPWTYYVFDRHDLSSDFAERFYRLAQHVEQLRQVGLSIRIVPTFKAENMAMLDEIEQKFIAEGHEGAIARDPGSLYKFGRASKTKGELVKIKRFVDFEAEVIGVYEEMHNANEAKTNALGRTERSTAIAGKVGKGTLGGLVLRGLNGPAEGVEFRCGTGFNEADRISLWAQAQYGFAPDGEGLNGRVAKVKSFPIGVKDKPRHPVFLGWRAAEDMPESEGPKPPVRGAEEEIAPEATE